MVCRDEGVKREKGSASVLAPKAIDPSPLVAAAAAAAPKGCFPAGLLLPGAGREEEMLHREAARGKRGKGRFTRVA